MKLVRLLLQAFGPFTNKVVDFPVGTADLHLIHGPNEAGKSSALRAMTDLRFGIPVRSPDDFVHAAGDLRIAGVFLDQAGNRVGLIRRKGRGATLSRLNLGTEEPDTTLTVDGTQERELTGGLERTEFEAMFGLNHARLREGGKLLLNGEGDLGSALFEASAGTHGIAALLAALEADEKKLYSSHGRAQNAVINEARRKLEEHRQAWRQAQTKPADWQALNRAHETALATVDEITKKLEILRQRENELTELRTVEPLLRDHDLVAAEVQSLAGIPDLAENCREERLAAVQAMRHAQQILSEAEAELERCAIALNGLAIEPQILTQGEVIERLISEIAAAGHYRIEVQQQEIIIERIEQDLDVRVARLASGRELEAVIKAVPSDADRIAINDHLLHVSRLQERLQGLQQRAEEVDQLITEIDQVQTGPALTSRQALAAAIRQAQSLGDVVRQKADFEGQIREFESQLQVALSDLGTTSEESLRNTRPILETSIAITKQELIELDEDLKKARNEYQLVGRDLDDQWLRQRQLAAEGEVVTSETLRRARMRRDEGWTLIRKVYIERDQSVDDLVQSFDANLSLPGAFEAAETEADRQADLLRADAKRATSFEECLARIEQMDARRQDLEREMAAVSARRGDLCALWTQRLREAGLPNLEPDALREWQGKRLEAFKLAERVAGLRLDWKRLLQAISDNTSTLIKALQGIGNPVAEAHVEDANELSSLIDQATRWEQHAAEAEAKRNVLIKTAHAQRLEQDKLQGSIGKTETELHYHQSKLRDWHVRLFMPSGGVPDAIKARLDELDQLGLQVSALSDARARKAHVQAILDDLRAQSKELAGLLGEPALTSLDDFASRLRRRLFTSRENEQQRNVLIRDQSKAQDKKRLAEQEQIMQQGVLVRLCAAAGVETIDKLPELEEMASLKRQAHKTLLQLSQQLVKVSARPKDELRKSMSTLDSIMIDSERERCRGEIQQQEQEQVAAQRMEEQTRQALQAIDASDRAAIAREAMESAAARYRGALRPWARLKLARALLQEALNRFRERAQGPMIAAASSYFALITGETYERLLTDETEEGPVLCAVRKRGARIGIEEMSEGTADQLYLALRLAALALRRTSHSQMPLILDDALVTSDDDRAANILRALSKFSEGGQVMIFTHHRHLIDVARSALGEEGFVSHAL